MYYLKTVRTTGTSGPVFLLAQDGRPVCHLAEAMTFETVAQARAWATNHGRRHIPVEPIRAEYWRHLGGS